MVFCCVCDTADYDICIYLISELFLERHFFMTEKTIFEKILHGEIPCKPIYEDEYTLAFHDINPQAPVHILVIPKRKIINVANSNESDIEQMGRVLFTAKKVAEISGIDKTGYRLIINNGDDGGQTVYYMHCHILGGRSLSWPPG